LATGVASSQRGHIIDVKEIITELENRVGKTISIDDILKEAAARGIEDDKVEEVLEKLKRSGDIFEPRRGVIQKL
jgi:replicative DNA helicase Mcm